MAVTAEALHVEMEAEAGHPIEAPAAPSGTPIDDSGSLSDHEQKYQQPAQERRSQPRSERDTKRGTVEDVPKIQELTRTLREAEEALGIKREDGESDRVYNLRARAEVVKRLAAQSAPAPVAPAAPVAPKASGLKAPAPFTEKEPVLADFEKEADPWSAHNRALSRYDRRKEAHEESVRQYDEAQKQVETQNTDAIHQHRVEYANRLQELYAKNPEAQKIIADAPHANQIVPIAMEAALTLSPNGAAYTLYLAQHPEMFDEIFVMTDGRAPSAPLLAQIERTLAAKVQAGTTGAAAPPPKPAIPPAPRVPTPVRTTPHAPVSDGRPKDDDSLSAHEAHHYPRGPKGQFRR